MAYSAVLTSAAAGTRAGTILILGHNSVQRGTLVTLSILGLGLALAALSLSVRYRAGDRALAFWTPPVAVLIARAPQAELWKLADKPRPGGPLRPPVSDGDRVWHAQALFELAKSGGFSHARHALLEDASFAWDAAPPAGPPDWQYALRLENEGQQSVVLFDLESAQVGLAGRAGAISIAPLAPRLRIFFDDVLSRPQAGLVAE
jgi:hypothetical protein